MMTFLGRSARRRNTFEKGAFSFGSFSLGAKENEQDKTELKSMDLDMSNMKKTVFKMFNEYYFLI